VGRTDIRSGCDGLGVLAVLNYRVLLTQQVIAFYSDYELCNKVWYAALLNVEFSASFALRF
jgi:hypothetical protein